MSFCFRVTDQQGETTNVSLGLPHRVLFDVLDGLSFAKGFSPITVPDGDSLSEVKDPFVEFLSLTFGQSPHYLGFVLETRTRLALPNQEVSALEKLMLANEVSLPFGDLKGVSDELRDLRSIALKGKPHMVVVLYDQLIEMIDAMCDGEVLELVS